jgi:hypothetical protein
MTLRSYVLLLSLALIGVGSLFVTHSMMVPEWTDKSRAMETISWPPPDAGQDRAYDERWHTTMDSLRTAKWPQFDAGSGLVALGFSLAATIYLLGIRKLSDMKHLKTPRHGWAIYAIAILAWGSFWGQSIIWLYQDYRRWQFPTWADSLAIPLYGITSAALLGWFLLTLLLCLFVLRRAELPADLWIWRKGAYIKNWGSVLLTALSLIVPGRMMYAAFRDGPYAAIPAALLWGYATLIIRSATMSHRRVITTK